MRPAVSRLAILFVGSAGIGVLCALVFRPGLVVPSEVVPKDILRSEIASQEAAIEPIQETDLRNAWASGEWKTSLQFAEEHREMIDAWAAADPDAVLRWAEEVDNFGLAKRLRYAAVKALAYSDLERALRIAAEIENDPTRTSLDYAIAEGAPVSKLRDLIEADPFGSSGVSGFARRMLYTRWVAENPVAALAFIDLRRDNPGFEYYVHAMFHTLYKKAPATAIAQLTGAGLAPETTAAAERSLLSFFKHRNGRSFQKDRTLQTRAIVKAVEDHFHGDATKAYRWILEKTSGHGAVEVAYEILDGGIWNALAHIDGADLSGHAAKFARENLLEAIGQENPETLLSMLDARPELVGDEADSGKVFASLVKVRPRQLLDILAEGKLAPDAAGRVAGALVSFYHAKDPAIVIDTILATQSSEEVYQRMLTSGLGMLARHDPADARSRVAVGNIPGVAREHLEKILYYSARTGEHLEALAWGRDHVDQLTPAQLADPVAAGWAGQDALAASGWVASLPPGPERDGAISGLVRAIQHADPASATEWANQVGDIRLRSDILSGIGRIR